MSAAGRGRWRLRALWGRICLAPFESAIAALIVAQAVIAVAGVGLVDPVETLLPDWLATGFNVAYLAAGLLLLFGVLRPRGDVEGAGLVLLACLVIGRGFLFGTLLGWGLQSITSLAFSTVVAVACVARIHLLVRSGR
ncbi:MAG TPA: hypothetical protein VF062_26890 [Candidatus Limnocylindrales bacterium]